MLKDYRYDVDEALLDKLLKDAAWENAFNMLAAPLHEALYAAQSFDLLDSLTSAEQVLLSFDYIRQQVGQGGFIQLIQNGYISLLVTLIEALQTLNMAPRMVQVLDDALKVFVLNKDELDRETSLTEFGRLYEEFTEFELSETRFNAEQQPTIKALINYLFN